MPAPAPTADSLNAAGRGFLPGFLGIEILGIEDRQVRARLAVQPHHLAPNGFLHAGAVVTLADTAAGYACIASLPPGAQSFTTIELKSNHLGTARDGAIEALAAPVHLGKTTQVWDVTVTRAGDGKTLALFRCTQLLIYPT